MDVPKIRMPIQLVEQCEKQLNIGSMPGAELGGFLEVFKYLDEQRQDWMHSEEYLELRPLEVSAALPESDTVFLMRAHLNDWPDSPLLCAICKLEGHEVQIKGVGYFGEAKELGRWLEEHGLTIL